MNFVYPFTFKNFNDDFDLFRGSVSQNGIMRTNIVKSDEGYELSIEVPGFKKDEISIEFEKDNLVVSAKRKEVEDNKNIRKERFVNNMYRSYYLGDDIDEDNISASLEDGILTINLVNKVKDEQKKKQIFIQ